MNTYHCKRCHREVPFDLNHDCPLANQPLNIPPCQKCSQQAQFLADAPRAKNNYCPNCGVKLPTP